MDVRLPDGTVIKDVPDGMTRAELTAKLKANGYSINPAAQMPAMDPTEGMSTFEKLAAGAGKAIVDTGRGLGQWVGAVDRKDVAEARKLDSPLMNTGAGMAGNLVGNAAMLVPTAFIPGANTLAGAGMIGAVTGAAQPSESGTETLANIGLGGAGGVAGQKLANMAGGYVSRKAAENAANQLQRAQMAGAAKAAMDAGYVIPPADLDKRGLTQFVSGLSGKIKTAQEASARNQPVTNALVRKELGVAPDVPLNVDTLNGIRSAAGRAYEAVASTGTVQPGAAYDAALDGILAPFKKAAAGFPNAKANPIIADIEALRSPAFDAGSAVAKIRELRDAADAAYSAQNASAGKAYKAAAKALEDAIDAHLVANNAPADLLSGYREARKLIAKTYTVQKALNSETGDVSAQVLGRELSKGRPLSGDIRTAAQAGAAFPKATQALKETPKALSPLDFATAGFGLVGSGGNPLAAAGLLARPASRAALLSSPAQRMALNQAGALASPNMLARLLQNEPVALPIGVLSGLGSADAMNAYLAQK